MTISFSNQLVAKMYQPFWAAWQAGEFLTDASAVAVPTAIAGRLGCVSPVVSARATLRRAPCLGSSGPSVRRASTIDGREPSTIDGREQITSLIGPRVP